MHVNSTQWAQYNCNGLNEKKKLHTEKEQYDVISCGCIIFERSLENKRNQVLGLTSPESGVSSLVNVSPLNVSNQKRCEVQRRLMVLLLTLNHMQQYVQQGCVYRCNHVSPCFAMYLLRAQSIKASFLCCSDKCRSLARRENVSLAMFALLT